MPCWEVRTMSVEFNAENRDMLDRAIAAVGETAIWTGSIVSLYGGAIQIDTESKSARVRDGYQNNLNELKRSYSREAVKTAAARAKWAVKFDGNRATVKRKKQW